MTREEAINKLVNARYADEFQGDEELTEAHLMAIKALENHDTFMKYAYSQGKQDALSQESNIDMESEEIKILQKRSYLEGFHEALKMSVKQEPCDDAISRDELLKAIETWDKFGCDANTKLVPYKDHYIPYIHYDDVIKCIKGMPPVTVRQTQMVDKSNFDVNQYKLDIDTAYECGKASVRQTGHWIETEYHRWKCSVCREKGMSEWDNIHNVRTNYCPNCGAKMESEDLGDYPDTIHNQFDNMTGSMNL